MRLRWLRALPRGLWSGPRVPQFCRSLCQRPARVPSEGGDTAGTPKPRRPQERDPAEGDTSRGDTSWGGTSGTSAWWRRHETQRRERPRGAAGGDTSRGDTFRGDTSRGGTSRGDNSGGDTFRGGTFRGDTSEGDTSRGDTLRGDNLGGDTSRGDTLRGDNLGGDNLGGGTFRGDTSRGDTSRGDNLGGDTFRGDTFRGDTSSGDTSRGDTLSGDNSGGYTFESHTSRGDTSGGYTSRGDNSGGYTSRGDNSGGDTSRGDSSGGDTSRGDTFRGDTSRGDTLRGDNSGGDTFRGDTSRGDTFRGDSSGADTSRGDNLGGDTSRGDTSGTDTSGARRRHRPGSGARGDEDPGSPGGGAAAFEAAVRSLSLSPPCRGGRVALVEAALAAMAALGAERSLGAYNALLRLLPRGPWVPRGPLQRLLFPFPRQQECGLRLLEQMERHGVMPDAETRFLLLGVFGPRSRPVRKVQRMLFWLPRLRHLDPHPLPPQLPPPGPDTARLGLLRIAGDPAATVTVLQDSGDNEGSVQPYIVSSQTPEQRELLAQHDPSRPVFVEGPFPLWLRGTLLKYFILRGDPLPPHLRDPPPDPERSFYFPLHLELDLERGPWDDEDFDVDEVEEGPVFALCAVGGAERLTLPRWISALQRHNPVLGRAPVIFRLGDPPEGPQTPQLTPPETALEPPEEGGHGEGDPPPK